MFLFECGPRLAKSRSAEKLTDLKLTGARYASYKTTWSSASGASCVLIRLSSCYLYPEISLLTLINFNAINYLTVYING